MKWLWWGLGGVLVGTLVTTLVILISNKEISLINPIAWNTEVLRQAQDEDQKKPEVIGFLPTWMVGKTKLYGNELTQLIFLGIEVAEDGSLIWDVQSKKINNDEYLKLKINVAKYDGKNILGIKLFEDRKLDKLMASLEAKQKLLTEVKNIVDTGKFDGVNIDFEYMSNPLRIMDADFGEFMDMAKEMGWGEISVDVFANTIIKGQSEKIAELANRVDKIIVMAYDFHRPGSETAGAVAPMSAEVGQRSINEIIQKIIDFNLPREKFVMAYPLYGYSWETTTNLINSPTRADWYGATVFYNEGVGFTGVNWDELSQTPWIAWQEKSQRSKIVTKKVGRYYRKVTEYYMVDQWHQAYFENESSLGIKVEAVRQNQLGGIGFWALGYEGRDSELIKKLGENR